MKTLRSRIAPGGLAAVSVVLALAAALALARAEREWPAFPTYESNLAFGPVFAGESLEQTFAAPSLPLRGLEVRAVRPWPDIVFVRIRDADDAAAPLLFEVQQPVAADGWIHARIPGAVDTSGRRLWVQIVNPSGSPTPLILHANRTDPYPQGTASARGDAGAGGVDLVMRAWRRVTPASLGMELLRAHAPGAMFAVATAAVLAGLAHVGIRRLAGPRSRLAALLLHVLAAAGGAMLLRAGFEGLAPWLG